MSGGRTSAFMTKKILDEYSDQYEIVVCFANTGQENDATLDFVKECPLLLVTIGKCKESRREWLNDVDSADDKKPEPNEVIRWI